MSTIEDYRKILEFLRKDASIGFSEQELDNMLEEELNRPVNEIDIVLIDEILKCLGAREVPQDEVERSLSRLRAKMKERFPENDQYSID